MVKTDRRGCPKGWTAIKGDRYWGYDRWYIPVSHAHNPADLVPAYLVQWDDAYYLCDRRFGSASHGNHTGLHPRIRMTLLAGPVETLQAGITAYYLFTGDTNSTETRS